MPQIPPYRPLPRDASDALIRDRAAGLARLAEIMRRLREPGHGCPWDLEQDFSTIAPYTIEEAYEVADAIARDAMQDLPGELGDLLLQVVFHAQMAEEKGAFALRDVIDAISEKMLNRHPHVFGAESRDKSAAQQAVDWETIKAAEREAAGIERRSALDGVAVGLPGMTRAVKLQARAARVGFDWPDTMDVLDKLREEAEELVEARESLGAAEIEEEYGDLLFVMANLGRRLKIDPESALRRVNAKFERRFRAVEQALEAEGRRPQDATLAEMDAHWDRAKAVEKAARSAPAGGSAAGRGK